MADFVFNIAKGKAAYLAGLPAANDALVAVPLETTGLESDATLKDADTLAAVLSGTTNEQTTMGRVTLTGVTVTTVDADDETIVDANNFTWTAAAGNPISAIVICYDPDTTAGTDDDLIPLTKHDFVTTPAGGDITVTVPAAGFYGAKEPA